MFSYHYLPRRSVLGVHWRDWCWSWNSNTSATWCGELTHLKRPWCWEKLRAEGEGDDRGWHGYMASPTQWTWVWGDSRSWWWTGRPGVLRFMGSQRVGHDWATELNWTEFNLILTLVSVCEISDSHLRWQYFWSSVKRTKDSHRHIYDQDNVDTSAFGLRRFINPDITILHQCPLLHQQRSKIIKVCPLGRLL